MRKHKKILRHYRLLYIKLYLQGDIPIDVVQSVTNHCMAVLRGTKDKTVCWVLGVPIPLIKGKKKRKEEKRRDNV